MAKSALDVSVGAHIDRYQIESLLGEGGFGAVYRAKHTVLGNHVALKVLHPEHVESEEFLQRFLREAQAAAGMGSPHIVRVLDCGTTTDGQPFLVMELLDGTSLEEVMDRAVPLPVDRAVGIGIQILEGLASAHTAGIVHRDLKPANVFLSSDAQQDGDFVKLLDFGISKVRTPEAGTGLTHTGAILGTPMYMPPEQFRGARDVDHRGDLYAAAAVLYEMLSGRLPHKATSFADLAIKVCTQKAEPLASVAPHVPAGVAAAVDRGLAPDPDDRWPNAVAFAGALRAAPAQSMAHAPQPASPTMTGHGPAPSGAAGTAPPSGAVGMAPPSGAAGFAAASGAAGFFAASGAAGFSAATGAAGFSAASGAAQSGATPGLGPFSHDQASASGTGTMLGGPGVAPPKSRRFGLWIIPLVVLFFMLAGAAVVTVAVVVFSDDAPPPPPPPPPLQATPGPVVQPGVVQPGPPAQVPRTQVAGGQPNPQNPQQPAQPTVGNLVDAMLGAVGNEGFDPTQPFDPTQMFGQPSGLPELRSSTGGVRLYDQRVVGTLEPQRANQLLATALLRIEQCRQVGVMANVRVQIHVSPDGAISLAQPAINNTGPPQLAQCCANQVQGSVTAGWNAGGSGIVFYAATLSPL